MVVAKALEQEKILVWLEIDDDKNTFNVIIDRKKYKVSPNNDENFFVDLYQQEMKSEYEFMLKLWNAKLKNHS